MNNLSLTNWKLAIEKLSSSEMTCETIHISKAWDPAFKILDSLAYMKEKFKNFHWEYTNLFQLKYFQLENYKFENMSIEYSKKIENFNYDLLNYINEGINLVIFNSNSSKDYVFSFKNTPILMYDRSTMLSSYFYADEIHFKIDLSSTDNSFLTDYEPSDSQK